MSLSPAELWYIDHDHALNPYTLSTKVCEPLHSLGQTGQSIRELGGQELRTDRPVSTVKLTRTHFTGTAEE